MAGEDDSSYQDGEGGGEGGGRTANGRQLSAEEEEMIMSELYYSAQENREFMKVLHILQNDGELRPLIFEHESLLRTLKEMKELKAEQMLSILTAAETEMYESSKKNEELIQQQKLINGQNNVPKEHKGVSADLLKPEDTTNQAKELEAANSRIRSLEKELNDLKA